MSSVTRFLKQLPAGQGQTYLTSTSLGLIDNVAYVFVPTSGNVVGNYPPGVMVLASAASPGLQNQIVNALTYAQAGPTAVPTLLAVLRDMGKTVFAPAVAAVDTVVTNAANYGYFRQVQLLVPGAVSANQVGGSLGSTFGVVGSNPVPYSSYLTFYLPVAVAGVLLQPSTVDLVAATAQGAGGQM
jgi:hypothetical protein